MSTPRPIAASEARKGMRVRVEQKYGPTENQTVETIEGLVISAENANIEFPNGRTLYLSYDHPVTVLADPEPEWVEGAWYWVELTSGPRRPLKRLAGGWTDHADDHAWFSDDDYPDIAVLGRVLIVDWPGDDVARELDAINDGNRSTSLSNYGRTTTHDTILRKVADAIRTQGGVR